MKPPFLVALAALVLSPSPITAQVTVTVDVICAFEGSADAQTVTLYDDVDPGIRSIIEEMLSYTGLPANFTIKRGTSSTAAAFQVGGLRYVVYNDALPGRVAQPQYYWALRGVFAHEIGHHLAGHVVPNSVQDTSPGAKAAREAQADRYAGFVLSRLGATLEQAKSILGLQLSPGLLTKQEREAAIASGWYSANQRELDLRLIQDRLPKLVDDCPDAGEVRLQRAELEGILNFPATRLTYAVTLDGRVLMQENGTGAIVPVGEMTRAPDGSREITVHDVTYLVDSSGIVLTYDAATSSNIQVGRFRAVDPAELKSPLGEEKPA